MSSTPGPRQNASDHQLRGYGIAFAVPVLFAVFPSVGTPSAFDTFGPGAERLSNIWWWMFWAAVPIYIATMTILGIAIVRSRRRSAVVDPREIRYSSLMLGGGVVLPLLVIVPLVVTTVVVGTDLSTGDEEDNMVIEVVGHQWWWEIRYPESDVITANEMHIPVDRSVQVRLTSEDVIHSFWAPQLQGKLDLIPGKTNTLWIEADKVGELRGLCAEHCGIQHTNMRFLVVVHPEKEFQAWLEQQSQPAEEPADSMAREGQEVFQSASCASCHQVQGHSDAPREDITAPDLTHLASRQEIAAGTLSNTRGNLGGWILDPQNVKPGTLMPPSDMDTDSFQALLAYLESLE